MLDNKKRFVLFCIVISVAVTIVTVVIIYHTKGIFNLICFPGNKLCVRREIEQGLRIEFLKDGRYFPSIIFQVDTPVFLWDSFSKYDQSLWGDNQNGEIEVVPRGEFTELLLKEKQMVWLLYRLPYGILEFRWLDLINSMNERGSDKFFGFGDPNEGLAAGFRIKSLNGQKPQLFAETINFGQIHRTPIRWERGFKRARYFIDWQQGLIRYSIVATEAYTKVVAIHTDKNIFLIGLPKGRMEVSIQNFSGKSEIKLSVLKYDAYD